MQPTYLWESTADAADSPSIPLSFCCSQLDDSEASVELHEARGTYNIVVHRVVRHEEIPAHAHQVRFGCELSIPGTDYLVREESVYEHQGTGRGESVREKGRIRERTRL